MTEIETMNAEQVLERSDESLADAHEVFVEIRILQRHCIGKYALESSTPKVCLVE